LGRDHQRKETDECEKDERFHARDPIAERAAEASGAGIRYLAFTGPGGPRDIVRTNHKGAKSAKTPQGKNAEAQRLSADMNRKGAKNAKTSQGDKAEQLRCLTGVTRASHREDSEAGLKPSLRLETVQVRESTCPNHRHQPECRPLKKCVALCALCDDLRDLCVKQTPFKTHGSTSRNHLCASAFLLRLDLRPSARSAVSLCDVSVPLRLCVNSLRCLCALCAFAVHTCNVFGSATIGRAAGPNPASSMEYQSR
jgi:hypothetical protein